MRRICVLFPGQGFQKFGMLSSLANKYPRIVEPLLDECDKALPSLRISELLLGIGEVTDLTPTEVAQPCLLASGVAHYQVWKSINPKKVLSEVIYGMGHSLGEYTAFTAAGLLPFSNALKLTRSRGEEMRDASLSTTESLGMSLFVKPKQIEPAEWLRLLKDTAVVHNLDFGAFNSPTQTVLSGSRASIAAFTETLKPKIESLHGRLIVKPLPVSAAFHSRYMRSASDKLRELVSQADWQPIESAEFEVISNVSGTPYASVEEIKDSCVSGLISPVNWSDSAQYAVNAGVDTFIGMGSDIQKLMEKDLSGVSSSVFKL